VVTKNKLQQDDSEDNYDSPLYGDNYEENYSNEKNDSEENPFLSFFFAKKNFSILLILLFIVSLIIIFLIIMPILRPDVFQKLSLLNNNGESVQAKIVHLDSNGNLISAFISEGEKFSEKANPHETKKTTITLNGTNASRVRSAKIVTPQGSVVTLNQDSVFIDENGIVTLLINPEDDLLLDEDFFDLLGTDSDSIPIDFLLQLEIENTNFQGEQEEIIMEIPMELIFTEFFGIGCLELNRGSIFESTHNGVLEVSAKLRVTCETESPLSGKLNWSSERMGNVELFLTDFFGTTLSQFPVQLRKDLPMGLYNLKIVYVPLKEYAGQKASFDLLLESGNSSSKLMFDVVGDNLEQCVKIESIDSIIENYDDLASISIDASTCHSQKIDIFICDGDPSCSFTTEGGVVVSSNYLTLSGNKKSIVTIQRGEIPGVYGINIKASIPGLEKNFIDEKEILVKPTSELVVPDRFVVSLIGKETSDVVKIKNSSLSEKTMIDSSVCNLYKSSLGISGDVSSITSSSVSPISGFGVEKSWLRKFYSDIDYYSGDGKYQTQFFSSLAQIENMRDSIQSISQLKNSEIKKAYLDIIATNDTLNDSIDEIDATLTASIELRNQTQDNEDFQDIDMTAQVASLTSSVASLYTTATGECVKTTAAELKTNSYAVSASVCTDMPQAGILANSAKGQISTANNVACGNLLTRCVSLYQTANNLKSVYDQIEALSEDNDISAANALENAEEASEYFNSANELSNDTLEYAKLILVYASLESPETISSNYSEVKKYLELAKLDNDAILSDLQNSNESFLAADDEITTSLGDIPEDWEIYNSFGVIIAQMYDLIGDIITKKGSVESSYQSAIPNVTSSATNAGSCVSSPPYRYCTGCSTASIQGTSLSTYLNEQLAEFRKGSLLNSRIMSEIQLVLQAYETWRGLSQDYIDELTNAKTKYDAARTKLDEAILKAEETKTSIDAAILAADYLARESEKISQASNYTTDYTESSDSFNKKEMTGLVSTVLATGFINGAYLGGVYTTNDTTNSSSTLSQTYSVSTQGETNTRTNNSRVFFEDLSLKENCDNRVSLTLIDYIINLLKDIKSISISEENVLAYVSFYEPKVLGFYEEQEANIVFANNGLKKNIYGVVSIVVDKHSHETITDPTTEFGPFNVQDSKKEETTYKYHFKFNAAPRKTSSTKTSAICSNELVVGSTGEEALPKTLLNWGWKEITDNSTKDKYIDSTQLSILISKRLSVFEDFLTRATISCPTNPVEKIIDTIRPTDIVFTKASECYLPLSTKTYDGKPALYYYLNSIVSSTYQGYDEFFDGPLPTNAEEGLNLVDFNVYLMRDGLGLDFQADFVADYTRSILKSSDAFTNFENGIQKYFNSQDRFFFTSQSQEFKSKPEFILPDAGLYNIRILLDFDDKINPRLFDNGLLSAKIKVIPTLIKPISENYSPFYYTPFDGSVGLNVNFNRQGYGTSLTSGANFTVVKEDASFLQVDQKNSLVKTKSTLIDDFMILNSSPSRRGKILEYSYIHSFPKTYQNDSNSSFIFSPTLATPLLLSMNAVKGQSPRFTYLPKKAITSLKPTTNNLFLLTGINGCKDFFGNDIMLTLNKTPDFLMSSYYGMAFTEATVSGRVSAKTISYAPTNDSFEIEYSPSGEIISPNNPTAGSKVPLDGISGMKYNDQINNSKIESLLDVFDAVKERSVCVTNASGKEIYYWPEEYLYEKENDTGESIKEKELDEKGNCIR